MKKFLTSLFICLSVLCTSMVEAQSGKPAIPQNIRVLILDQAEVAMVEVRGGYNLYDPATAERVATRFFGKRYPLVPMSTGISWGEEFPDLFQLVIVPDDESTTILVNGVQYPGSLYVFQIGNAISLVCEANIEDYVSSVLGATFTGKVEREVLAALAIGLRTDAYYHANHRRNPYWDVRAENVGFVGIGTSFKSPSTQRAVNSTRDLVMGFSPNGYGREVFPVDWTEDCGGKTAPYQIMHRKNAPGPHQGVELRTMAAQQAKEWSYAIHKEELARLFNLHGLKGIQVFAEQFSNKVYSLRIKGDNGSCDVGFFDFQKALGAGNLRSSDFTVSKAGETIVFEGRGSGAGVGICLRSASELASRGYNAVSILESFFPGTQVDLVEQTLQPQIAQKEPSYGLSASDDAI